MGEINRRSTIAQARSRAAITLVLLLAGMMLAREFSESINSPIACFAAAALAGLLAGIPRSPLFRRLALTLAVISFGAGWWAIRISAPTPGSLADLLARREGQTTILTVRGRI